MCKMCNWAKQNYSQKEFMNWISKIISHQSSFKEFFLKRHKDISGTSGTGIVARGIIFPKDGKVVMEWESNFDTITIFKNTEELISIHGHNGATEFVMGKPENDRS